MGQRYRLRKGGTFRKTNFTLTFLETNEIKVNKKQLMNNIYDKKIMYVFKCILLRDMRAISYPLTAMDSLNYSCLNNE